MFARLWWKEARQFWPIWLVLLVGGLVVQSLAVRYGGEDVRRGLLALYALGWAALYAVVAGAAAFAGEREAGTLALLDTLPVSRRLLWGGKASFAAVSTFGLAVLFLAMAAVSTRLRPTDPIGPLMFAAAASAILLETLGWGFFWSARVGSALTAGVLTLACTILFWPMLVGLPGTSLPHRLAESDGLVDLIPWRLGLAALLLADSARVTTRRPRPFADAARVGRFAPRWRLRVRSPLVVDRDEDDSRPGRFRKPIGPELWVLAWQTLREGASTWCLLAAIGVGLPLAWAVHFGVREPGIPFVLTVLVGLGAGVHVFNSENRRQTQRFLAHHGARAGVVWTVKVAAWSIGVLSLWAGALLVMLMLAAPRQPYRPGVWADSAIPPILAQAALAFGVGLPCGMMFRRGITAFAVSALVLLAIGLPLGVLMAQRMVPPVAAVAPLAALTLVSWGWRRDWLMDRPAPGRWVRLALLSVVATAAVLALYVAFRQYGVRATDPLPEPADWRRVVTDAENAAPLYREAARERSLERVRQAAEMPRVVMVPPTERTAFTPSSLSFEVTNARNLLLGDLTSRIDPGHAWDDLKPLLLMSRQVARDAGVTDRLHALAIERDTLERAFTWAYDGSRTAPQLREALKTCLELPPMPPVSESVRAEAAIVEQTLDLSPERLRDGLAARLPRVDPVSHLMSDLMFWPWEVVRTRKALRLALADALDQAGKEPWRRDRGWVAEPRQAELLEARDTTPLAQRLEPVIGPLLEADALNEAARRALPLYLALRIHQVEHDGRLPDEIETFEPPELPTVPLDPFRPNRFGYVRVAERGMPRMSVSFDLDGAAEPNTGETVKPFQRLLYSVGPDRSDYRAIQRYDSRGRSGDLIFPLPLEPYAKPRRD